MDDGTFVVKKSIAKYNTLPNTFKRHDPFPLDAIAGSCGRDERIIDNHNCVFTLENGMTVEAKHGKLYIDDEMIADFTNDTFQNIVAPYAHTPTSDQ